MDCTEPPVNADQAGELEIDDSALAEADAPAKEQGTVARSAGLSKAFASHTEICRHVGPMPSRAVRNKGFSPPSQNHVPFLFF